MGLRTAAEWTRRVAISLMAAAMVLIGAAHAPADDAPAPSDLIAYALPDGSLPELCVAGHAKQPAPGDATHHTACLVACLTGTPLGLPAKPPILGVRMATAWRPESPLSLGVRPRPTWTAAQARGPPPAA